MLDDQKSIKSNKTSETAEVFLHPRINICNNANTSRLKNNVPAKKSLTGKMNDELTREIRNSLRKLINSGNTTAKKEFISSMKKLYYRKKIIILFKNKLLPVDLQKS